MSKSFNAWDFLAGLFAHPPTVADDEPGPTELATEPAGLPPGWPASVPVPPHWSELIATLHVRQARPAVCAGCGYGAIVEWQKDDATWWWSCPKCYRDAEPEPATRPAIEPAPQATTDLVKYVAEHKCYPPEGIGRPGDRDRWLAKQEADGFRHWHLLPDAEGRLGWERDDQPAEKRWWARCKFDDLPLMPAGAPVQQAPADDKLSEQDLATLARCRELLAGGNLPPEVEIGAGNLVADVGLFLDEHLHRAESCHGVARLAALRQLRLFVAAVEGQRETGSPPTGENPQGASLPAGIPRNLPACRPA
ncbi:MAG: hypothetical protein ACUVXB_17095 [Bryobacteraceae bacterium]